MSTGASISIILNLDGTISIIASACISVLYTFVGGLFSVAYTDVIQLFCIFIGLYLAFPFAMTNSAVTMPTSASQWVGEIPANRMGVFLDNYCLLIFGACPWQEYLQRVLACRTTKAAMISSVAAGFFGLILSIPPIIIGVVGASADWNQTGFVNTTSLPPEMMSFVLPLVLQYLCPTAVSMIGLGAVSAAVMSSADSCVLAASTVFTRNIYKNVFRPKAGAREELWVLRIGIVVVGAIATAIAVSVQSIYGLFFLCSDLVYVIMFPQLLCVLWVPFSNSYGCLTGYVLGLFVRIASGERLLGLPPLIRFPLYTEEYGQGFPFRTLSMLVCMTCLIGVSFVTDRLFKKGIVPKKYDFLRCITNVSPKRNTSMDEKGMIDMETKTVLLTQ